MADIERALACQRDGFNCAQATFLACSEECGLDPETALRVSGAFGGGLCRLGKTCGAVTGALMALGLKYAMVRADDPGAKARMYAIGREFMARFTARRGSLECRDLLGCDISTPEGDRQAKENNLHATLCPEFIRTGAEIFNELMDEAKQKGNG